MRRNLPTGGPAATRYISSPRIQLERASRLPTVSKNFEAHAAPLQPRSATAWLTPPIPSNEIAIRPPEANHLENYGGSP